jgi:hypothetical protein
MVRETSRQDLYSEATNRIIAEMEDRAVAPGSALRQRCVWMLHAAQCRCSRINILILWAAKVQGGYSFAQPRLLPSAEAKEEAQKHFDEWSKSLAEFFGTAKLAMSLGSNNKAAFAFIRPLSVCSTARCWS